MSAEARAWAKKQRTGSPAAKSVLVALADYAGEKAQCWPSQETLARDTELSERAVRKHLLKLQEAGFISRTGRYDERGWRTSDLFTLDLENARHHRHEVPVDQRHEVPVVISEPKQGKSLVRKEKAARHIRKPPARGAGEPSLEPSLPLSDESGVGARTPFALSPAERSPPRRGTRLPEDWQPSDTDRAFAIEQGLSEEEFQREADQFRDHWTATTGAKAAKRDWGAAWRTWVRNEVKYRARRGAAGNGSGRHRQGPVSSLKAFARAAGLDPDAHDVSGER
jgi:DNA-binding transcriptional ArsR family regulator